MTVNADQLPAHVRAKLGLPARANRRPSGRSVTSGGVWTCPRCVGSRFTRWAQVDRHHAEHPDHGRFDCVLSGESASQPLSDNREDQQRQPERPDRDSDQ